MRLKRFQIAVEQFASDAPDGVVEKSVTSPENVVGDGVGVFSLRRLSHVDYDQSFFNIVQLKKVTVNPGFLTYSGSLSGETETGVLEVVGDILMVTPTQK